MLTSSFDSNLLIYAHNEAAPGHTKAKSFVEGILAASAEQIVIVHQTVFEIFSVLTSSAVFKKPLTPLQAWQTCEFYLAHSAVQLVSYEPPVLPVVQSLLSERPQRGKRLFDLVFAATLKFHGVKRVYTRNVKHFEDYSFLEVLNPL